MAHLNLDYLRENVSDDDEFIHQLLQVFLDSTADDLVALEDAIKSADHEQVKRAAHKVKSSFRSLGMLRITELLQRLEDMARNNHDIEEIVSVHNSFLIAYPSVREEVQMTLDQGK